MPLSIGIGLSLGNTAPVISGGGGGEFDADAEALFAEMDVQPDNTRKALYDDLIVTLKGALVWTKLDALWVLGAHDAQAARLNIKSPGNFTLTPVNTPTFTTDRGYAGNGSSSYLDTGFNPATASGLYSQNSCHMGCWARTHVNEATSDVGNFNGVSGVAALIHPINGGNFFGYAQSAVAMTAPVATTAGHNSWSRTASGTCDLYKNGANLAAPDTTSGTVESGQGKFFICAGSLSDAPFQYSTRQIFAAHAGSGLTDAEMAAIYDALDAFRVGVGA